MISISDRYETENSLANRIKNLVAVKGKGDVIRDSRFQTQRLAVSGGPEGRRRTTSRWFHKSIEDLLFESFAETPLYKRYSLAPILQWDHKSTRSQMEEDDQLGAYT